MSSRKIVKYSLALSLLISTLLGGNANAACEYEYEVFEEYYEYNEPSLSSMQTRTFENTNVRFSFEIPENYRVMGSNEGMTIAILNSPSYNLLQCMVRNGYGTDSIQPVVSIDIRQVSSGNRHNNLHDFIYDLVIENYPYMRSEGRDFWNGDYSGNPAVLYSQTNLLRDTKISYISFLSLDRRYLITISGPYDGSELVQVINSFRLLQ